MANLIITMIQILHLFFFYKNSIVNIYEVSDEYTI